MTLASTCIAIAAILPIVCAGLSKWGLRGYDNRDPRGWAQALTGHRKRANAAQANSWEAFPVFAAGVLVAQQAGAAQATVDTMATAFIVARIAYIALYIADLAALRSVVWIVGFALSLGLYFVG